MTHAVHTIQALTITGNLLAVAGAIYVWRLYRKDHP